MLVKPFTKIHGLILLVCLIMVVLSTLIIYTLSSSQSAEPIGSKTILRTDSGFSPAKLTIPVGTQVTFTNVSDGPMWPASDMHPSHLIYPEFDSRGTIPAGGSWSHTFSEAGNWTFHDHIASQFIGKIIVVGDNTEPSDVCEEPNIGCWMQQVTYALEQGGVTAAFDQVVAIHSTYPQFSSSCHNFAHDIGLKTYILYGTDFPLTPNTSYCNAGFFHGFMEGLIDDIDNLPAADDFCIQVGNELSETFPLAEKQCRHGIGHGVLEYYINNRPDLWRQPDVLLSESIQHCQAMHTEFDDLMRCNSGVFNVYRDFILLNDDFQEYVQAETVFQLCTQFPDRHTKEGCYWEIAKVIATRESFDTLINNGNLDSDAYTLEALIPAEDSDYTAFAIRSWAMILGKLVIADINPAIAVNVCKTIVSPEYKSACLQGVVEGAFTSALPQQEFEHLIPFCNIELLTDEEQLSCFIQFQADLAENYESTYVSNICELLPATYRNESACSMQ